jgi:hypothetical protein
MINDDIWFFQMALHSFNGGNWYGWKTHDDGGNKIPDDQRMTYANIKVIKEGATIPSEADVNAKKAELKKEYEDKVAANVTKKASGKQKLKDLGLDDDEIQALIGV